jgi:hypothetical protein
VLDLFDPQSLNRYSYVLNNPLKYVDPSGHILLESPEDPVTPSPEHPDNPAPIDPYPDTESDASPGGGVQPAPVAPGPVVDSETDAETVEKDLLVTEKSYDPGNVLTTIEIVWGGIFDSAEHLTDVQNSVPRITVQIPNYLGGNFNVYSITVFKGWHAHEIRRWGRFLGEDKFTAPVLIVGLSLTIIPSIIENAHSGAGIQEYVNDVIIDSGGFIVSEGVGDIVGVILIVESGPFAPFAFLGELMADTIMGYVWDYLIGIPFKP